MAIIMARMAIIIAIHGTYNGHKLAMIMAMLAIINGNDKGHTGNNHGHPWQC